MNALKLWSVFAVGVVAGATVALIYAPQTGEKTRKQLKRRFEDAGEYLKDASDTLGGHAEKAVKRGREAWEDVADSASKAAGHAAKTISDLT